MNPFYQMMQSRNQNPMLKQFMEFKNSFHGDARAQVQAMLNSGRISQEQYNRAVQMAQQLQSMLTPGVRG